MRSSRSTLACDLREGAPAPDRILDEHAGHDILALHEQDRLAGGCDRLEGSLAMHDQVREDQAAGVVEVIESALIVIMSASLATTSPPELD